MSELDQFLLTKEQEFWFWKGWNQLNQKLNIPETETQGEKYWKKSRMVLELRGLAIIHLLPEGYNLHRKAWRIWTNTKYWDKVFLK